MALVHLTLFPDPVEVPDDEVPVLAGQGLIRDPAKPVADVQAEAYEAAKQLAAQERAGKPAAAKAKAGE